MSFLLSRTRELPTTAIATDAYRIPLLQPEQWIERAAEGELAVDVYETDAEFVIQSTLAGVRPEDLGLSLHGELLTIRGERTACAPHTRRHYLHEECYWGKFSRSILLPETVDAHRVEATLRLGVLTIILPKREEQTAIEVHAVES